jgi:uncharacterized protein with PIN domain
MNEVDNERERLFLEVMLGKLAVYLRLCGYDAAYAGDRGVGADDRLLAVAAEEDRLLLTRDVQLADRADRSSLLTEREVGAQLEELRDAGLDLEPAAEPTRCGRCNGRLDPVAGEESTAGYAPDPAETDCWRCRDCGQVFWRGSHWERMRAALDREPASKRATGPSCSASTRRRRPCRPWSRCGGRSKGPCRRPSGRT